MAIPVTTRQPFQRFHYTLPPSLPTTPDSNSQTKRPRHRRLRVCTPEPNSLLSILRARPRVKLYTNPVIWTTLQPQLLSCKFVHRGRVPERSPDEPRIWGDSILARDYDMAREHSEKIMIVAEIVMACGGTDMGANPLPFYFNGRAVCSLRLDRLLSTSKLGCPDMALMAGSCIRGLRREYLMQKHGYSKTNNPNIRYILRKLMFRMEIATIQQVEDPYVVALLIALAQLQKQYRTANMLQDQDDREGTTKYKVSVILLPFRTTHRLILFTASVPNTFLQRLEQPSRYIPSDYLSISSYRIPLNPPEQLVQRLRTAHELSA